MSLAILIMLAGVIGGFASSAPIGPINFWIADAVIGHEEKRLPSYVLGVIAADCGHAVLAAWGYFAFLHASGWDQKLSVVGGLFLVVLGLMGLWSTYKRGQLLQHTRSFDSPALELKPKQTFLLGLMMCGANPAFPLFWLFVLDTFSLMIGVEIRAASLVFLVIGIVLGDALWFWLLIHLAKRGRDIAHPRALHLMRKGIAVFFILLGAGTVVTALASP